MKLLFHKFFNLVLINDTFLKIITNTLALALLVVITMNATTSGFKHYLSYIFFLLPLFIIVKNVYLLSFSFKNNIYFQGTDFFKRPKSKQNSLLSRFLSCFFEDIFFSLFIYLSPILGSIYLNYRFDFPSGDNSMIWIGIASMLYISLTSISAVFAYRYHNDLLYTSILQYLIKRKEFLIQNLFRDYSFLKQSNNKIEDYKLVVNKNQFYQSCIILRDMLIYYEEDKLLYNGKIYGFSAISDYIDSNGKKLDELTSDDFAVIDMMDIK